ncbi:unnamed protein product [Closterium sp. Naga37s-1]|nr:unnamed protein product [Closterium sp. Naga37s-1]
MGRGDIRRAYTLGRELGKGGGGVVRECLDPLTGQPVAACKTIPKTKLQTYHCNPYSSATHPTHPAVSHTNYAQLLIPSPQLPYPVPNLPQFPQSRLLSPIPPIPLPSPDSSPSPQRPDLVEELRAEVAAMRRLAGHAHVVRLLAVYEDDHAVHVVMELCTGGDLYDLLTAATTLPEPIAAQLTSQILKALSHCHRNGILHRDIKPENILLANPVTVQDGQVAIIDAAVPATGAAAKTGEESVSTVPAADSYAEDEIMQDVTVSGGPVSSTVACAGGGFGDSPSPSTSTFSTSVMSSTPSSMLMSSGSASTASSSFGARGGMLSEGGRGAGEGDGEEDGERAEGAGSTLHVKLADFGLSVMLKTGQLAVGMHGSNVYMAPEVVCRKPYGLAIDLWGLGVILFTALSGYMPFWGNTDEELFVRILRGRPDYASDPWPSISAEAKDLVHRLLTIDPPRRINADVALQHPWILKHCGASAPSIPASLGEPAGVNPKASSHSALAAGNNCTSMDVPSSGDSASIAASSPAHSAAAGISVSVAAAPAAASAAAAPAGAAGAAAGVADLSAAAAPASRRAPSPIRRQPSPIPAGGACRKGVGSNDVRMQSDTKDHKQQEQQEQQQQQQRRKHESKPSPAHSPTISSVSSAASCPTPFTLPHSAALPTPHSHHPAAPLPATATGVSLGVPVGAVSFPSPIAAVTHSEGITSVAHPAVFTAMPHPPVTAFNATSLPVAITVRPSFVKPMPPPSQLASTAPPPAASAAAHISALAAASATGSEPASAGASALAAFVPAVVGGSAGVTDAVAASAAVSAEQPAAMSVDHPFSVPLPAAAPISHTPTPPAPTAPAPTPHAPTPHEPTPHVLTSHAPTPHDSTSTGPTSGAEAAIEPLKRACRAHKGRTGVLRVSSGRRRDGAHASAAPAPSAPAPSTAVTGAAAAAGAACAAAGASGGAGGSGGSFGSASGAMASATSKLASLFSLGAAPAAKARKNAAGAGVSGSGVPGSGTSALFRARPSGLSSPFTFFSPKRKIRKSQVVVNSAAAAGKAVAAGGVSGRTDMAVDGTGGQEEEEEDEEEEEEEVEEGEGEGEQEQQKGELGSRAGLAGYNSAVLSAAAAAVLHTHLNGQDEKQQQENHQSHPHQPWQRNGMIGSLGSTGAASSVGTIAEFRARLSPAVTLDRTAAPEPVAVYSSTGGVLPAVSAALGGGHAGENVMGRGGMEVDGGTCEGGMSDVVSAFSILRTNSIHGASAALSAEAPQAGREATGVATASRKPKALAGSHLAGAARDTRSLLGSHSASGRFKHLFSGR